MLNKVLKTMFNPEVSGKKNKKPKLIEGGIMNKKICLLVSLIIFFTVMCVTQLEAGWGYKRNIDITYTGSALSNYQVQVELTTANFVYAHLASSDSDDIRFSTDVTGTQDPDCDYWIESWVNGGDSKIWVEVPSITGNMTIYMYYGNASASSESSLANTFPSGSFIDTFADETKIDMGASSDIAVSGGEVKLNNINEIWYETYGPDGTNDVVQIGNMYVARNTNTAGTAYNGSKNWQGALDWAAGLNWLEKTNWRMPTIGELSTIYSNRGSLGSYNKYNSYWSSTAIDATYAWSVYFDGGYQESHSKAANFYVRAVRVGEGDSYSSPGTLYSVTIPEDISQRLAVGTQLSWTDTEPTNTDVKYQIEYYDGTWQLIPDGDLSGNSAGFDTSPVDVSSVKTDYGQIRLKGNLSTTDVSVAPSIQDWTVTYYYREYSSTEPGASVGNESGGDYTLPVELSIFTAQFIENIPTLYWSTQSETDNMGWFVYRNEENDFTTSERISEFIEGHGTTTQQQSYIYEDSIENPEVGDIYYYWLESIDYSGKVHHYDKVAIMHISEGQDQEPPIAFPLKYGLQYGPNPFSSNLNVSYMLRKSDMVRVEIYNIYGQLLTEFDEGQSTADKMYKLKWNGKDLYGKDVSSGVLLIKLITTEGSETKKAILLRCKKS